MTVRLLPEDARPYQGRPAGLVSRLMAAAIDAGVVVLVLAGIYAGWAGLRFVLDPHGFSAPAGSALFGLTAAYLVLVLYLTGAWITTGRSYGNVVMGLRVVGRGGVLLHPAVALLRASAYAAFPAGLLWVAVSRRNRSVQDLLVRSSVIYDWKQA